MQKINILDVILIFLIVLFIVKNIPDKRWMMCILFLRQLYLKI